MRSAAVAALLLASAVVLAGCGAPQDSRIGVAAPPRPVVDEWPLPGSSVFQATCASVSLVGMFLAWLMPVPFGPRKRGHCSVSVAADLAGKVDKRARLAQETSSRGLMGRN